MSTIIPDIAAAEGVVLHWLRHAFDTSPAGSPDFLHLAAADALFHEMREEDTEFDTGTFGVGVEFGVRVALAVTASPLGGAEGSLRNDFAEAVAILTRYHKEQERDRELAAG